MTWWHPSVTLLATDLLIVLVIYCISHGQLKERNPSITNRKNSLRKGKHKQHCKAAILQKNKRRKYFSPSVGREEQKGWTLNHSLEANCWCRPRPGTRLPNRVQGCDGGSPMTPFSLAKKWGDPTSMPILSTGTNHFLQFKERGPPPVRGHLPTGFGSHWATPACLGCFHQQLYLLTLLII